MKDSHAILSAMPRALTIRARSPQDPQ